MNARDLPKTVGHFVPNAAVPAVPLASVEGKQSSGPVTVKPLVVGEEALMLQVDQGAGLPVPEHIHADHESVIYLVKGRIRLTIGGETFEAKAGDAWIHRRGVPHSSVTLEPCTFIEVKTPPRKTW